MKKSYLILVFFLCLFTISAQTFSEVETDVDLPVVLLNAVAVGDLDGDMNEDLFIQGFGSGGSKINDIYLGNGDGTFKMFSNSFFYLDGGTVNFEDFDLDGDLDMIRTGSPGGGGWTIYYTNNGNASFSEVQNTPFANVYQSSVVTGDVNGDNYADILLSGRVESNNFETALYLNNGDGSFKEADVPFPDVAISSVHLFDANGDSHLDAFISGFDKEWKAVADLYFNDGNANFTFAPSSSELKIGNDINAPITDVADFNQDGFIDIFVLADKDFPTTLYVNDGLGNFTSMQNIGIYNDDPDGPTSTVGEVKSKDINGDGSPDLLIAGSVYAHQFHEGRRTNIFLNDGTGNFTLLDDTPFEGGDNPALALVDFNHDELIDVMLFARAAGNVGVAKIYLQEQDVSLTKNLFSSTIFNVYPNPIAKEDNSISIEFNFEKSTDVLIQLIDIQGKILRSKNVMTQSGDNHVNISIPDHVIGGTYTLCIFDDKHNKLLFTSKVIRL